MFYISKIKLKSFKSYDDVTINFDKSFNVIIGENNVGKSTIFEALQLWKKCYDMSIIASGKKFYSKMTKLYITFEDLNFIRIYGDDDIFFPGRTECCIAVTFIEEIDTEFQEYTLEFALTKPNIKNAYIRVCQNNEEEFAAFSERLSDLNIKLQEFIFIHQTSPISNVLRKEPYMYKGQVLKKIQNGKSDEVLRNKILQSIDKDTQLEEWMQEVLDINFKFVPPKRTEREKNEYIRLLVEKDNKKLELYLQGSGFLQIAEIFSTIEIMNNSLNILLIDEPDSHISPRIQNRLLSCLKNIGAQTFVVSHNDNFVADIKPENILFVNEANKSAGIIEALEIDNVDLLHTSLGGIITGLTKLQKYKTVFFVEGKDDIAYIKKFNDALKRIGANKTIEMEKISFWFVRGRDSLNIKVMTGKQLLAQAVSGCRFNAIFDKDYSTTEANSNFINTDIKQRLGNHSIVHTHNGYCIESVLFSNTNLLISFLTKRISYAANNTNSDIPFDENINLGELVNEILSEFKSDIQNVGTVLYGEMKEKFKHQKKPQRPELSDVEFDDFAAEAKDHIQFIMNKNNIAKFVLAIEERIHGYIFERENDDCESISSKLLETYFESIENEDDIYPDFDSLINVLQINN